MIDLGHHLSFVAAGLFFCSALPHWECQRMDRPAVPHSTLTWAEMQKGAGPLSSRVSPLGSPCTGREPMGRTCQFVAKTEKLLAA
jgi:hypothetical protein